MKTPTVKERVKAVKTFLLDNNKTGYIYSVGFYKRTNGKFRKMVCRGGVTKGLTGEGLKYNPSEHDLVTVFDMQKKAHRMIPCENVFRIKDRGKHYAIT